MVDNSGIIVSLGCVAHKLHSEQNGAVLSFGALENVLGIVLETLGAYRISLARYSYSHDIQIVQVCGETCTNHLPQELFEKLAARLKEKCPNPLYGSELSSFLYSNEKEYIKNKTTAYIPISSGETIYAVILLESEADFMQNNDLKAFLLAVCEMLTTAEKTHFYADTVCPDKNMVAMPKGIQDKREDILSQMSLEIRTPINAIIGLARVGAGSGDIEKARECLETIESSSVDLLKTINDILDMTALEANKMVLEHRPFDLENMLMKLVNVISHKTADKNQKLHIHIHIGTPNLFFGDEARLSQVVQNILSNAIKFTSHNGKVRIDVKEVSRDAEYSCLEFRIKDTGIGVPKERHPHLIKLFEKANGEGGRRFEGKGLGLAISRNIIDLMNGDIRFESTEGKGTEFAFTIKLKYIEVPTQHRSKFSEDIVSTLRIINVDDTQETSDYFEQIMEGFSIKTDTVPNISACIAELDKAIKSGNPYNLIFVDWNMLKSSGLNTARSIFTKYGCWIMVLIPTAQRSESLIDSREFGIIKYIDKPFFPSMLFNALQEFIHFREEPVGSDLSRKYIFSGHTVLHVEDFEINRDILGRSLEAAKINVVPAENGKIAYELFKVNPDMYDLILMDINMPIMDGYEATELIRSLPFPKAKTIPILAVTANAFEEDVNRSKAVGMNGHLTKPVDLDTLFSLMSKLFSEKSLGSNIGAESEIILENANRESNKYIGYDEALRHVNNSRRVLKTLLTSFKNNTKLDKLVDAVAADNFSSAAKIAKEIMQVAENLYLFALVDSLAVLIMQFNDNYVLEESMMDLENVYSITSKHIEELVKSL